jgi:hypothetical protein
MPPRNTGIKSPNPRQRIGRNWLKINPARSPQGLKMKTRHVASMLLALSIRRRERRRAITGADYTRVCARRGCEPQKQPQPGQYVPSNHHWFDSAHAGMFKECLPS